MRSAGFLLLIAMQLFSARAVESAEHAAEPEASPAGSLDDFEILQYVAAGAYPPGALIAMDNNARILLECREGRSVEELRASSIGFADSQIEFLIAMQLLFRDGEGDLHTAFPILDAAEMSKLRGETSALADAVSATVRSDAEALALALASSGYGDSGYPIFFSYVLDGMVWGFFEEYQKVPPRRLSARRPFWAGEVWAIRPERESSARTLSMASGGLTFKVTSRAGDGSIDELFVDRAVLKEGIAQFSAASALEQGAPRSLLARFGVVDAEGRWIIPVIDEVKKDPVNRAAEVLTSNLVDAILDSVDLEGLRERYRFRSPAQALVVVYHELMWDLIDRFEKMGVVTRPDRPVVAAAAFLVDQRRAKPKREDVVEPKRDSLESTGSRDGG